MRFRIMIAILVMMCVSCSSQKFREASHDWLKINWDWQTHVLERREAWDDATGRKDQYQGASAQLAR